MSAIFSTIFLVVILAVVATAVFYTFNDDNLMERIGYGAVGFWCAARLAWIWAHRFELAGQVWLDFGLACIALGLAWRFRKYLAR